MALTNEDIRTILELRTHKLSYRKIVDKTGYGDKTVIKMIKDANLKIHDLVAQGLDAEKIAERLDYPLQFVNEAIDSLKDRKTAISDTEEKTAEPVISIGIKEEWYEFQSIQQFSKYKEQLRTKTNETIMNLRDWETLLNERKLVDNHWGILT
jgi:hypothetical protein